MRLLVSRNPNPRLASAVSRYLGAPVTLEFAAPFAPGQAERFRKLNPNLYIPILIEDDGSALWETDAIACRLSQLMGADFWRQGAEMPDMIRWIGWAHRHFTDACDIVHFERGTKQRYRMGPIDADEVQRGLEQFHRAAPILVTALDGRDWLGGAEPSYADFRMASFLPFNDVARLPLDDYPELVAWNARLRAIPAWRDPFDGIDMPPLPPVAAND